MIRKNAMQMKPTRRESLAAMGAAALLPAFAPLLEAALAAEEPIHIATNTYPWLTSAQRSKVEFRPHSDELLAKIAETGIKGYEPIIHSPSEFEGLGARLQQHGLEMRSIYVNSVLHDPEEVEKSIDSVTSIARAAHELGAQIVVTNPSPIRWGGAEDKSDTQLRFQAKSLDRLGAELRNIGVRLAYHNHDAELRHGGREFHHMLTATDPENVKFCLDAHWVFRGCGDSEVAIFDVLHHYHDRIVELHLRQSTDGIWNEAFQMSGDINYDRLLAFLADKQITPHLVLEQAVEQHTPNELGVVEAHRRSYDSLVSSL